MQDERICPTVAKRNGPLETLCDIGRTPALKRPGYLLSGSPPCREGFATGGTRGIRHM
jgi:hypothetical protein